MAIRREQGADRPVVLPADEQPFAPAGAAAPLVVRDTRGRLKDSASARAMAKLPRGEAFLPRKIVCDARFDVHNRRRGEWLRRRRAEVAQLTGAVSHGVGAMLSAAAWLYAGGEYAAERAAETLDVDLFKSAATLTATARTHDMGAWELAVRAAQARPKTPVDPLAAWRTPAPGAEPPREPE